MPPIKNPESTKKRSTPLHESLPKPIKMAMSLELEPVPTVTCQNRTNKIATPRSPSKAGTRVPVGRLSAVGSPTVRATADGSSRPGSCSAVLGTGVKFGPEDAILRFTARTSNHSKKKAKGNRKARQPHLGSLAPSWEQGVYSSCCPLISQITSFRWNPQAKLNGRDPGLCFCTDGKACPNGIF
jgi:hypothetical protein